MRKTDIYYQEHQEFRFLLWDIQSQFDFFLRNTKEVVRLPSVAYAFDKYFDTIQRTAMCTPKLLINTE